MSAKPDTSKVMEGLKDFQRATVDYVCHRFFESGDQNTKRFLVADEVGLGKTLVARGVIARTIDYLWDKVPRIDVIYICSNADIARQNMQRLNIPGCDLTAQTTRLTLLPLHLQKLNQKGVNFIALTPNTAFEQSGSGGRMDERVLLYWLLDQAWKIDGARASLHVLRNFAGINNFESAVKSFDIAAVNQELAAAFVARLNEVVKADQIAGKPDLRSRFEELRNLFCRSDSIVNDEGWRKRGSWLGEMRRLLARVCLNALEPDLIILDEFQRFKHLLGADTEAGELARHLFESDAGIGARVLLLSATPYRGLSLHHEQDEDHYGDFVGLLEFLEDGNASDLKKIIAEYREAIPGVRSAEGMERLRRAKDNLQIRLKRVMTRTERSTGTNGSPGMLVEMPPHAASLSATDLKAFLGAQNIAAMMEQGDVVEYWKSAPYLFNFMDSYALKKAFKAAAMEREMVLAVRKHPSTFLDLEKVRNYKQVYPSNSRLRALIEDTVGAGMWKLLWIPPAMPYYQPSGPFAKPELKRVTKRLVFSAWHMVPKAVASMVSYEAERRMMRASDPRDEITQKDWQKQASLLRFGIAENKPTGMPLLLLIYPSLVFARDFDPRDLARTSLPTADGVRQIFAARLKDEVEKLGIAKETGGNVDERWYWLAPILLDQKAFPAASEAWWNRADLASAWAGSKTKDKEIAWPNHVEVARQTLLDATLGNLRMGPQPQDFFDVLALAASASPATSALRAYSRVSGGDISSIRIRDVAARTGRAFLTLFNHAEVTEMVRAEFTGAPYWERVLDYTHAGGLQAALDEYAHLLRESRGVAHERPEEMVEEIASEVISSLTLQTASLQVDDISAPPHSRHVEPKTSAIRIRFAMRFGDERNDEEAPDSDTDGRTRKERVRAAFNSPFWPFVLATTSVGQEGLDFHHYCHAITHWNLPANPVDLEQREGRIHRYKGHAIRKNLADRFSSEALKSPGADAWEQIFETGLASRAPGQNHLVPFWLFPGDAKIERHVPRLPFSREVERLDQLRRALAIYRMVFGQSRQEDLITYLLGEVPEDEREKLVEELQINLSPDPYVGNHS